MQYILEIFVGPAPPRVAGFLHSLQAGLALWRRRNRTRRQLAMLDGRALADLGLSPAQQRAEAGKWFWQP